MAWFDRHAGDDARAFFSLLDAAVADSGLLTALDACAGPRGLRRFVVRLEPREGRLRVADLDAPRLPRGGGPPGAGSFDAGTSALEQAAARLRDALRSRAPFDALAVGYVRDAASDGDGPPAPELSFRFDEDISGFSARSLREPRGPCTPMEDPAYVAAAAQWSARVDAVRANWRVARGDWAFEGGNAGRATLGRSEVGRADTGRLADGDRRWSAVALGTWHAGQARFSWLLTDPAGEEAPFVEPDVWVDLSGATELACFAACRLGCTGVFQGELETGQQFFAGLRA